MESFARAVEITLKSLTFDTSSLHHQMLVLLDSEQAAAKLALDFVLKCSQLVRTVGVGMVYRHFKPPLLMMSSASQCPPNHRSARAR